jgi:hypothetical protein
METASQDVSNPILPLRSDVVSIHDPIFEIQRNSSSLQGDCDQLGPEMDVRTRNMPSILLENNQILMRVQNSVESQGQQLNRVEALLKVAAQEERLASIKQIIESPGIGPESKKADSQQNVSALRMNTALISDSHDHDSYPFNILWAVSSPGLKI